LLLRQGWAFCDGKYISGASGADLARSEIPRVSRRGAPKQSGHTDVPKLHGGIEEAVYIVTRSNDAYKAAFMNMFAFTDLQRIVAEQVSAKLGREIKAGQYVHIADSYHIYGSYFGEFERFLRTVEERTFEERTWTSEFAEPFFEEGRRRLERESDV